MAARRLVFLLLVYVSLDFANPLMPGAVQFLDGSVRVVKADRIRPESPPVDVALLHHRALDPTALATVIAPRRCRIVRAPRPPLVLARRPLHAPPDPALSSEAH